MKIYPVNQADTLKQSYLKALAVGLTNTEVNKSYF